MAVSWCLLILTALFSGLWISSIGYRPFVVSVLAGVDFGFLIALGLLRTPWYLCGILALANAAGLVTRAIILRRAARLWAVTIDRRGRAL